FLLQISGFQLLQSLLRSSLASSLFVISCSLDKQLAIYLDTYSKHPSTGFIALTQCHKIKSMIMRLRPIVQLIFKVEISRFQVVNIYIIIKKIFEDKLLCFFETSIQINCTYQSLQAVAKDVASTQ